MNLNYMGFHKILKKHDKMLPHSPCRQFYISHLHNQPWVQGNYADLLLILSSIYATLRGDVAATGPAVPADDTGFVHSTTKYWVRMSDVSTVKHHILQHLPVYVRSGEVREGLSGDAQLTNNVYLDNSSLELYHARLDKRPGGMALRLRWVGPEDPDQVFLERKTHRETWKGDESIRDVLKLKAPDVVPFLEGELSPQAGLNELVAKGANSDEQKRYTELWTDIQKVVDAKQLKPMVRTQYMRTEFQIPFDSAVRASLDTNICMIKENPEEGPLSIESGRWYRDPSLPITRTEITRFPHAVLQLRLHLSEGEAPPEWVQELLDSGLLTEVHKFSKFIHATATLLPDMVQAVPYWVDDESVRASMVMSAPDQPEEIEPGARDAEPGARSKPRKHWGAGGQPEDAELTHPLLGESSLSLMRPRGWRKIGGGSSSGRQGPTFFDWWFAKPPMQPAPLLAGQTAPSKAEAKTFMANERTFLAWLHMAVTIGSISAALQGFAGASNPKKTAPGSNALINFISIVLLPVAVLMSGYALMVFFWRRGEIKGAARAYIDDRRGPLALSAVIVTALSMIFVVAFADLISLVLHHGAGPSPPAAGASLFGALLLPGGSSGTGLA